MIYTGIVRIFLIGTVSVSVYVTRALCVYRFVLLSLRNVLYDRYLAKNEEQYTRTVAATG